MCTPFYLNPDVWRTAVKHGAYLILTRVHQVPQEYKAEIWVVKLVVTSRERKCQPPVSTNCFCSGDAVLVPKGSSEMPVGCFTREGLLSHLSHWWHFSWDPAAVPGLLLCELVPLLASHTYVLRAKFLFPSQGLSQHARVVFVECGSECHHGGV